MKKYFNIGILFTLLLWAQSLLAQESIPVNTYYSFEATSYPGYTYQWWYVDEANNKTNFESTTSKTEDYFWSETGQYQLFVQATDANNCLTEIISKDFSVAGELMVSAGKDTTINSCDPYTLQSWVSDTNNVSYLWKPADNLDNPTSANPVFTPGNTTLFELTVTSSTGTIGVDSVLITVSELIADAGDDMGILDNSSVLLDATGSSGENLSYLWTTINGEIVVGETTANPVVSEVGTYYLQVTDKYTCTNIDSVNVFRISPSPVAVNDYDTTDYGSEVIIDVIDNDTIPENTVDPSSMYISEQPFYGTAYVDYNDFTIHYTPDLGFNGTDNFGYQFCDTLKNCTYATVFVLVNNYDFLIPDAFSPNGDGINDYFEVIGIERFVENKISIFNRWGNKVYEANRYGISSSPIFWDGKSNTGFLMGDEELPTGSYYYVLKLGSGQEPVAGSIYLDR